MVSVVVISVYAALMLFPGTEIGLLSVSFFSESFFGPSSIHLYLPWVFAVEHSSKQYGHLLMM